MIGYHQKQPSVLGKQHQRQAVYLRNHDKFSVQAGKRTEPG
jgi:hypothetical protein